MTEEGICAQNLACAIVRQASYDYVKACRYQYKTIGHIASIPDELTKEDRKKRYSHSKMYHVMNTIEDCEWFFDNIVLSDNFRKGELTEKLREIAKEGLSLCHTDWHS